MSLSGPHGSTSRSVLGCLVVVWAGSCATSGYEIVSRTQLRGDTRSSDAPSVKPPALFGVDPGGRPLPDGCEVLGLVEAWSLGEKAYPHTALRNAARELGGNAVAEIEVVPERTGRTAIGTHRNTWTARVLLCPSS